MTGRNPQIDGMLATLHPYDSFSPELRASLAGAIEVLDLRKGSDVYRAGEPLDGLYIVADGEIEVREPSGLVVSILGSRNSFGERGLLRNGKAATSATALSDVELFLIPVEMFRKLIKESAAFARFFDRSRGGRQPRNRDLSSFRIVEMMAVDPLTCAETDTVARAATIMRENKVTALPVLRDDTLVGIVTQTDLTGRVLAEGRPAETPVAEVMTRSPMTLRPTALGADVLNLIVENGFRHLPIVEAGRLVGIVSQTDLIRQQSLTSGQIIEGIVWASDIETIARNVARIPDYLVQLVGAGNRHEVVTRLITDIGDAATRRLLKLAEDELGAAPVPYLWLACGSQGRQEQTGVSDQDNCLILSDDVREADLGYFDALAKFVSDGLDACGYFYCPGDMMATNPRWRQPLRVWREYFAGWIRKPDPMAQMLSSVMFDLRAIGGDTELFDGLQAQTLHAASQNSIFVAHMVSNSLKHTPPLSMFRGFATIRSGEHRNTVDLKHNGVVPVVDLGRIYALQGELTAVNTRARLEAAAPKGVLSSSGARDLIDAYDLIAETRLQHQASQIRAGEKPDNFMTPAAISDFERSHLRDAFVVIKTMQSVLGHGRGALS